MAIRGSKTKKPVSPIELDSSGVAWIRGKQVKVIEIVLDKLAHGGSVKEIRSRFPGLTQKQVSAALDYFRNHQDEFQTEIQRYWQQISQLGIREANSPFQRRLRELSNR
ncbi:MAG: DUF433 domain-containing protein [Acidobacteria bacterium]|nr:DUF433 domain-containing protein [Acidobacteriota bacterium]